MIYPEDLKQVIKQYQSQIEQRDAEITELRKIVASQQDQIKALQKEVQELKEKLGTNSSNSSLPPSQDSYRKKRQKEGKGRKPGGQPGHPGHSRKLYPPEEVKEFVEVRPSACPHCGDETTLGPAIRVEKRQQIDLPEIKPEVTQYNIQTCLCGKCGKHVTAELPKKARKGFGPRVMGFLTILSAEANVTRSAIVKLLGHLGIRISPGSVSNIQKLATKILDFPYELIKKATLNQLHINADESGWKNKGKKKWIWTGATKTTVFFKIDTSRSQAAFHRIFGSYDRALTTDRYTAYNIHEGQKQTCWAHLDRDFTKIKERGSLDALVGRLLEEQTDVIFTAWQEFKTGKISREEIQQRFELNIIPNFKSCLKVGASAVGLREKTQRTCCNLLSRFKTLWLFLYREDVEPTNNLAERALRLPVIKRKISFGSQSDWGERYVERVLTLIMTFRQLAKNSYEYLVNCFRSWQRDGPIPSPF